MTSSCGWRWQRFNLQHIWGCSNLAVFSPAVGVLCCTVLGERQQLDRAGE